MTINNFQTLTRINTPIQKTGNNGYHYLFLVNEEQLKIIGASLTGLYIDGIKYTIDYKVCEILTDKVSPIIEYGKCLVSNDDDLTYSRDSRIDSILNNV